MVAPDGIPWEFAEPRAGTVVIGDLHGDFRALCAILIQRGLIDETGRWTGGATHVFVVGDLLGRGTHSRAVMALLLRLESEARAAGGHLESLYGNHESLVLVQHDFRFVVPDLTTFDDFLPRATGANPSRELRAMAMLRALSQDSALAPWLRRRNTLVRVGDTLVVHAGIESWAASVTAPALNATVRAWFAYAQGARAEAPPENTRWVLGRAPDYRGLAGHEGPLWTSAFSPDPIENQGVTIENLPALLGGYGARRMVIGHITTPNHQIMLSHPTYGDRVVLIDTALSDAFSHSVLSTLEIQRGIASARYYQRPSVTPSWVETLAAQLLLESRDLRSSHCVGAVAALGPPIRLPIASPRRRPRPEAP